MTKITIAAHLDGTWKMDIPTKRNSERTHYGQSVQKLIWASRFFSIWWAKLRKLSATILRASRLLCTFQATGLNWKINILTFRLKGRLRSLCKSSWIRTPWNSINHKSKRENQNVCSTYQVNFISGENVIIPTKGNSNISKSTQNQTVNWSVWPISHTTLVGVSLLQCQVLNFASIPEWSWI